jgi:hypothetical protein
MKMGVNIWVTEIGTGNERIPLPWGIGMYPRAAEAGTTFIYYKSNIMLHVRETPAEIAALVAEAERKQARERIAAMALQGALANPERVGNGFCAPIDEAIKYADGLLDALAAREGA